MPDDNETNPLPGEQRSDGNDVEEWWTRDMGGMPFWGWFVIAIGILTAIGALN